MTPDVKKQLRKISNVNSALILSFYCFLTAFLWAKPDEAIASLAAEQNTAEFNDICTLVLFLLQYLIAIPLPLLLFRFSKSGRKAPKLKDSFSRPQMSAGWVIKWIFISLSLTYIVSFLGNGLFSALETLTGIELHPIDMTANDNGISRAANVIAMMFLAPFFEELFFRARMYRNTEQFGGWSMIIASGIAFGLWHGNYQQMLYTATLGICACFLTAKTKSVLPSMLSHFILNTIAAVQSIFIGTFDHNRMTEELTAGKTGYLNEHLAPFLILSFISLLIIGIIITGMVLFITEIVNHKDSFRLDSGCTELSEKRKCAVYFTAPATIIVTLFCLSVTIFNAVTI